MTARYARLAVDGRAAFVKIEDGRGVILDDAPWLGGAPTGAVVEGVSEEGATKGAKLLAPVLPKKIICVGRNYRAHAKELGNEVPKEPLLFLKPSSSLLDPGGAIELPPRSISERVDHEGEIAAVVGKKLRRVTPSEALDGVFGLTLALDVTARDLQKKDGQWTRAKGMDTFCPVGPVVVMGLDVAKLALELRVNGELRQRGEASAMIFSLGDLLSYIAQTITLEPGDLVLTGTPEGVGPLAPDDVVEHRVAEIGTLRATVVAPSA